MPKNNTTIINDPKSKSKSKSTRKPFRDISNPINKPKSVSKSHKQTRADDDGDDALDRLLLVHSDLSSVIHQLDELVTKAIQVKVASKKDRKEIESFAHVLSDMQTSLKPWIPRFRKVLSNCSAGSENQLDMGLTGTKAVSVNKDTSKVPGSLDQNRFGSLVSPSPLVSWRAGCTTEAGRQLFLLTPVPRPKAFSSKLQGPSKMEPVKIAVDESDHGLVSPEKLQEENFSVVVTTPRLKLSPPKSCILLEPTSEYSHKKNHIFYRFTPVTLRDGPPKYETSGREASEHIATKYPEIFGAEAVHKLGNRVISPPKTCVLLEPLYDQSSADAASEDVETNLPSLKDNYIQGDLFCASKECTPMLKDPDTTIRRGKRPGENTLKKELWTRFDAATTHEIRFKASLVQETASDHEDKGFLDRLEEVS